MAVANTALLLPGLSCSDSERPATSCTPRSVTATFSSSTEMVLSARMASDRGDRTCRGTSGSGRAGGRQTEGRETEGCGAEE